MSIETPDANFAHLYPPFADALKKIITQATTETAGSGGGGNG